MAPQGSCIAAIAHIQAYQRDNRQILDLTDNLYLKWLIVEGRVKIFCVGFKPTTFTLLLQCMPYWAVGAYQRLPCRPPVNMSLWSPAVSPGGSRPPLIKAHSPSPHWLTTVQVSLPGPRKPHAWGEGRVALTKFARPPGQASRSWQVFGLWLPFVWVFFPSNQAGVTLLWASSLSGRRFPFSNWF